MNSAKHSIYSVRNSSEHSSICYKNQTIDLEIELTYNAVTGYRNEAGAEMPIVASRTSKVDIQVTKNQTIIFQGCWIKVNMKVSKKFQSLVMFLLGELFQKSS